MKLSIKQLINELAILTNAHNQIKSFHYGNFLDIIQSNKVDYTSMMCNISQGASNDHYTVLNVDLFCCDKTLKDDKNKVDVESNTNQILNDFKNIIKNSPRWQNYVEVNSNPSTQKYYDRFSDVVTGWNMRLTLDVYAQNGYCDVPVFGYNFESGSNFEFELLTIVRNSIGDTLATKIVSISDNIIDVPDISFTDSDGSVRSEPSGVDLVCAAQDDTLIAEITFVGTIEKATIAFSIRGATTYTQELENTNVGTVTISIDDATYTTFTYPFTPTVGVIYYLKRGDKLSTGTLAFTN